MPHFQLLNWGLDKGGAVDDPTPVWGPDAAAQSAATNASGAGGVGGLVMASLCTDNYFDPMGGVCYGYDANGDVMTLVNMGGNSGYYLAPNVPGSLAAYYMYDPFGGLALATGNFAYANPFRFSTKYAEGDFALFNGSIHTCSPDDLDPGLYYYGQREYRTDIGRFMSRDPMDEAGGLNLYAACGNDLVNNYDLLGLVFMPPKQPTEAALINELQNQVNSWRGEQYNFAADLLQYFLSKQGGTMTPPMDDIIELKNDPKYRTRALGHFATKAEQMLDSGESGTYPIPTPNNFEIQYNPITDNPDLFYAFGNSHFSYNGTICLSAQARTWSVNVLMTQKDNYDFEAGPLNYRNESPTYYAGYLLEFKYGYPSFFDVETWNDYFDNTMEFPQE